MSIIIPNLTPGRKTASNNLGEAFIRKELVDMGFPR
jgi:hypothetical protein